MSSTVRPLRSSFKPGPESSHWRYTLKMQLDLAERLPSQSLSQRRPIECIALKTSSCAVPTSKQPPSPGPSPKEAAKRKRLVKESDLIRSTSTPSLPHNSALQLPPALSTYLTVNCYDFILFLDLQRNAEEGLSLCEFSSQPLCHDISAASVVTDNVDICIGFASGDVALWSPQQRRLTGRYNREKTIDSTAVTCAKFLPFEGSLLAVGHESGFMYIYDRRFTEESPFPKELCEPFSVQMNPRVKCNPTQKWAVSSKALNDFIFSPTHRYCAIPSRDSHCHVIDWEDCRLKMRIQSFFGAILCASWSGDERYLVGRLHTGGEDDAVCIYDLSAECIVARCIGHRSWVTAVAFDPWRAERQPPEAPDHGGASDHPSDCAERYCLVSAGQDARVLFWEFEPVQQDEGPDISVEQSTLGTDTSLCEGTPPARKDSICPVMRSAGKQIPILDPVSIHRLHHDPICSLLLWKEGLITVCSSAIIKHWQLACDR